MSTNKHKLQEAFEINSSFHFADTQDLFLYLSRVPSIFYAVVSAVTLGTCFLRLVLKTNITLAQMEFNLEYIKRLL